MSNFREKAQALYDELLLAAQALAEQYELDSIAILGIKSLDESSETLIAPMVGSRSSILYHVRTLVLSDDEIVRNSAFEISGVFLDENEEDEEDESGT